MPLQNRVTPFGEIVAVSERGLFTGNRGIIHDPATRTLLARRWTSKAWIVCSCEYKGARREVMARRSWTELFFLDEATALTAGHRPCFRCRRGAAEAFRAAWAEGNGVRRPLAREIDAVLDAERRHGRNKRLHPLPGVALPDGAMIVCEGAAHLVTGGTRWRWSPGGYAPTDGKTFAEALLTPPSTLRALVAGYRPVLHPSVRIARTD